MEKRAHWDAVYSAKGAESVSWYAPKLERSLALIEGLGLPPTARIIDVGGGASTLARDLLDRGFERPSVLDISAAAVDLAKAQLGEFEARVDWIVGDVTSVALPAARFDVWHDRAVFHFLTDEESRRRYVAQVLRAVKPGGFVIVATFGPQGPTQCSGLDVVRYSDDALHAEFGAAFEKLSSSTEVHTTPWGSEQAFLYCLCRTGAER